MLHLFGSFLPLIQLIARRRGSRCSITSAALFPPSGANGRPDSQRTRTAIVVWLAPSLTRIHDPPLPTRAPFLMKAAVPVLAFSAPARASVAKRWAVPETAHSSSAL